MSDQRQPVWPLVLMLIFYALLLMASGGILIMGMAFGSESYRSAGIPLHELLLIGGPFLVTLALIIATVLLWNARKYTVTYILFGVSLLGIFGMIPVIFGVAI